MWEAFFSTLNALYAECTFMLAQPEKIEQTSKSPKNIQYPISITLFYLFSVLSESVGPVFFLFRERRAPQFFPQPPQLPAHPEQPPQPPLCLIIYASAAARQSPTAASARIL